MSRGLAIAIAGVIALSIARADDGQSVHRCVGEHGEIVFSGLPCSSGALPAPGKATAAEQNQLAVMRTCPSSPDALRNVVADALARRDANALAGLMRWEGVGGGEARQRLRELSDLSRQPLLGIDFDSESGDVAAPESAPSSLRVRTGSGDSGGVREHEFHVTATNGCYWLDW